MVTSAEAADILGVDRTTLSRWSDERLRDDGRRITHIRLASGAKLYRRADVEKLRDEMAEAS
jgi:predicted site-specific integrase-resolvase